MCQAVPRSSHVLVNDSGSPLNYATQFCTRHNMEVAVNNFSFAETYAKLLEEFRRYQECQEGCVVTTLSVSNCLCIYSFVAYYMFLYREQTTCKVSPILEIKFIDFNLLIRTASAHCMYSSIIYNFFLTYFTHFMFNYLKI